MMQQPLRNHTLGSTMLEKENDAKARAVTRAELLERFLKTPAGRLDAIALWWACATLAASVSLFAMVSSVRLALLW